MLKNPRSYKWKNCLKNPLKNTPSHPTQHPNASLCCVKDLSLNVSDNVLY